MMLAIKSPELSLLDTSEKMVREWYVCYYPRTPHYWFSKPLKQGFRHVDLIRAEYYGPGFRDVLWLKLRPTFEMIDIELDTDPTPPWQKYLGVTVQKVVVSKSLTGISSWWDMGPRTCVETVKSALGINAFLVRTPWQLYQYINKRRGVISG